VAPGGSAAFLAPLPLRVLESSELARVLLTLGIRTLGQFATLPADAVGNRFGAAGIQAHRLARGLDPRPPAARRPAEDLIAQHEFEEPAETDQAVVFVAKMLADRLYATLGSSGLACTRLGIEMETASGRACSRLWRLGDLAAGRLSALAVAQRAAWQLDGWRIREAVGEHADPVVLLRLVPDQLVVDTGSQQALWGAEQVPDRVCLAAERVQGMLGHGGVMRLDEVGGRDPAERIRYTPFGDLPEPDRHEAAPWPGALPSPHPPYLSAQPLRVNLLGADGTEIGVSGRARLTAPPAVLVVHGQRLQVTGYAGPWPFTERWWNPATARRRARLQCTTSDGRAWLLAIEGGTWHADGTYQ
jgi:protein ImuB